MMKDFERTPGGQQLSAGRTTYLPELLIALLVLLLVAGSAIYLYRGYNLQHQADPAPGSNLLADGWQRWEGVDHSLQEDGSVAIKRGEFYAPYLMLELQKDEVPGEVAVIGARMKIEGFSGQAYTLLTAYTVSGPVALVVSRAEGDRCRLGIAGTVDQAPHYAGSAFLEQTWHDLQLVLDDREGMVYAYLDGKREVSTEWGGPLYPLREIWLGAFWVGGSSAFGVPVNQVVATVTLGDEMLLPADRTFGQFFSDRFTEGPWLKVITVLIALALVAEVLLLAGRRQRRHNYGRAGPGEDEAS